MAVGRKWCKIAEQYMNHGHDGTGVMLTCRAVVITIAETRQSKL